MLLVFLSRTSQCFFIMFQAAAKTFLASNVPVSRGISLNIRRYCKKTPITLRISEALSGAELGANVKVKVTLPIIVFINS